MVEVVDLGERHHRQDESHQIRSVSRGRIHHSRPGSVIQCLFCFGVDEVLISVAWIEDAGVMRRIIKRDGSWFERNSDCCTTLTEEWRREGLYFGYRPALVGSLDEAFRFLGAKLDDIDHLPRGPLVAPRHWIFRDQ